MWGPSVSCSSSSSPTQNRGLAAALAQINPAQAGQLFSSFSLSLVSLTSGAHVILLPLSCLPPSSLSQRQREVLPFTPAAQRSSLQLPSRHFWTPPSLSRA